MTMARGASEIDRLIEEGLSLYGEGDLDGALLLWERVLVIDPENAQANSYVDYVRMNYELLTSDNQTEESGPFGIDSDEPEYQIEISPGDAGEPPPPLFMDEREHGWGIGDEPAAPPPAPHGSSALTLELEADEPPLAGDPQTFETRTGESDVSFDDATREYPGGRGRPAHALLGYDQPTGDAAEFNEVTPPGFTTEDFHTPAGFGAQTTDVRRRDLGFVQPIDPQRGPAALAGRDLGTSAASNTGPPELKMTLRTPPTVPPGPPAPAATGTDRHRALTPDGSRSHPVPGAEPAGPPGLELDLATLSAGSDLASSYASLELELPPSPVATVDLTGRTDTRPSPPPQHDDDGSARGAGSTRPFPSKTRPPAFDPVSGLSGQAAAAAAAATPRASTSSDEERPTRDLTLEPTEPALKSAHTAPTQELPYVLKLDPARAEHGDPQLVPAASRDFADKPTNQIAGRGPAPRPAQDLITAPTRELGLRELALTPDAGRAEPQRPDRRAPTDDEITGVDVLRARPPSRGNGAPEAAAMDAIDARSTEILDDVDRDAPATETREERTRRRITALLDRAAAWSRDADFDRAVAAVDLALSEDPNSALAQKLIHRNRDAIMNAFQAFLGDLQRTPVLARPLHELASAPISPRAAFLLSRIDGTLSLDEILDVSGMPRLEAYRYLCQLLLRGILR